jgi:hypothetical protein
MNWPLVCVDNFFDDPSKIVEYADTLEYQAEKWNPGIRTPSLHVINNDFFVWVNKKILALFYPNQIDYISWTAHTCFVKVPPNLYHDGWVHTDQAEFTAIIYLSDLKNCGTTIFDPITSYTSLKNTDAKISYFKDQTSQTDVAEKKLENNENFEESIIIKSKFNRLVIFDSSRLHAAVPYISDSHEQRLTMITNMKMVQSSTEHQLKFPISEMRRI